MFKINLADLSVLAELRVLNKLIGLIRVARRVVYYYQVIRIRLHHYGLTLLLYRVIVVVVVIRNL